MNTKTYEFTLERVAKNTGGDRYGCVDDEDFVVYLPQAQTREGGGAPKRRATVVVSLRDEEDSPKKRARVSPSSAAEILKEHVQYEETGEGDDAPAAPLIPDDPDADRDCYQEEEEEEEEVKPVRDVWPLLDPADRPMIILHEQDPATGAPTGRMVYRTEMGIVVCTRTDPPFPLRRYEGCEMMRNEMSGSQAIRCFRIYEIAYLLNKHCEGKEPLFRHIEEWVSSL